MRRLALSFAFLAALAVPAAAVAAHQAAGDGSLVVKHGAAPTGSPVVVLQITGSVIGEVDGGGKIVIDAGPNGVPAEVTGSGLKTGPVTDRDSAQQWQSGANDFKFRVVGGSKVWIAIYGTDVNLVALGKGWVKLQGSTDTPRLDGKYSLNGDDGWKSLPGAQSDKLFFPASNG